MNPLSNKQNAAALAAGRTAGARGVRGPRGVQSVTSVRALVLTIWRMYFSKPLSRADALEVVRRAEEWDGEVKLHDAGKSIQKMLYAQARLNGWIKLTGAQRRRYSEVFGVAFGGAWQRESEIDARLADRRGVGEYTLRIARAV